MMWLESQHQIRALATRAEICSTYLAMHSHSPILQLVGQVRHGFVHLSDVCLVLAFEEQGTFK